MDIDRIIILFESILLERKLFLISKHKTLRTQIAEALIGLIYPFSWPHVLIPVRIMIIVKRYISYIPYNEKILPDSLRSYIDAPVPFIIGLANEIIQLEDNNAYNSSNTDVKIYFFNLAGHLIKYTFV